MIDLELGDIVLYKKESQEMTVVAFDKGFPEKLPLAFCRWLDNNNTVQNKHFHAGDLIIIKKGSIRDRIIEIHRTWDSDYEDLDYMLKRPRVDYRISEYVVEHIHKLIPQFDKILGKGDCTIGFSFDNGKNDVANASFANDSFDAQCERLEMFGYYVDKEYSTEDTQFILKGKKSTFLQIMCSSTKFNEQITPMEYAGLVYNMVSVLLKNRYKK